MGNKMEVMRIILKIIMWVLIIEFGCNFVMQTVSYSFYKKADKMTDITSKPQYIQIANELTGYGYHLEVNSNKVYYSLEVPIILLIIQLENMRINLNVLLWR